MKINSIQLKNYKGFEDSGKVSMGSVTSIIGRNGHGKTTLIDAIRNTFKYETINPNSEQRNGTDKNPTVCLECEITPKDGISGITSDTIIKFERTGNEIVDADTETIKQIFSNTKIIDIPEIIQNPLHIDLSDNTDNHNSTPFSVLINEKPGWRNIFGTLSITPDYIMNQLRDENTQMQFHANSIEDFAREFTEHFNKWTMHITNRTYDFRIFFRKNSESSLVVYTHVRHKLAKSQEEWSQWSKLEQKSESFRILLTLASHRFKNDGHSENYIFLFDEPYVNMHPSMQVEVKNILKKFSEHHQIIYTTHSPYLKQENNSLYCIEKSPDAFVIKTEDQLESDEKEQYIDDFSMITPHDLQRNFDIPQQLPQSNKELICFVEGKTDVEYIKYVLNVHDKAYILDSVDIFNLEGHKNLDKVFAGAKLQREKLGQIEPNLLFIYDCDVRMKKKTEQKIGLFVKQIPTVENGKIENGIENLLSNTSIEKAYNDELITKRNIEKVKDDSGKTHEVESYIVKEGEKRRLQEWACKQPKEVEDFNGFEVIISIIESTLKKINGSDS